jgi:hypothetical protein
MRWVNANDRLPERFGSYFALVDGRKDILHKFEFDKRKEFSTSLLWLEEDEPKPTNGKQNGSYFKKLYGLP